jgi:general secretion pathway protein K
VRVEDLLALSGFTPQSIEQLRDYRHHPAVGDAGEREHRAGRVDRGAGAKPVAVGCGGGGQHPQSRRLLPRHAAFTGDAGGGGDAGDGRQAMVAVAVKSNYFLAYSRVRLDRAALDTQSLLSRPNAPNTSVVWIREN